MTIQRTLTVVIALVLPASVARSGIEEHCSAEEEVGEMLPSTACAAYLSIVGEVAAAAAPCWEQISEDLPFDEWSAAREQCEAQAHLAVCGHVPCY
jgi:hypothetical protein